MVFLLLKGLYIISCYCQTTQPVQGVIILGKASQANPSVWYYFLSLTPLPEIRSKGTVGIPYGFPWSSRRGVECILRPSKKAPLKKDQGEEGVRQRRERLLKAYLCYYSTLSCHVVSPVLFAGLWEWLKHQTWSCVFPFPDRASWSPAVSPALSDTPTVYPWAKQWAIARRTESWRKNGNTEPDDMQALP